MEKIVTYQAKLSDRAIHRKDVGHLLHTRKSGHWHKVDHPALCLQLEEALLLLLLLQEHNGLLLFEAGLHVNVFF